MNKYRVQLVSGDLADSVFIEADYFFENQNAFGFYNYRADRILPELVASFPFANVLYVVKL